MKDENENSDKYEKGRLEWIDTFKKLDEYDKEPSGLREKMVYKIKENPFVPIGVLATTLALSYGIYAMRTGNKQRSQLMMRARVGAQGFTIAAILIGITVAASKKEATK